MYTLVDNDEINSTLENHKQQLKKAPETLTKTLGRPQA